MTETNERYDIVFLALARNCERTVLSTLEAIDRLQREGLRIHMVVGENGSSDATPKMLESARRHGTVSVIDTGFMTNYSTRLERLARGRQRLAAELKNFETTAVGVVDLDEPFLAQLSAKTLSSNLRRLSEAHVFGVSATSRPTYYDLLAFEDDFEAFASLDGQIRSLERNPIRYYKLFRDIVYPSQQRLTSGNDLLCTSAFNGLALYEATTYRSGTYLPPVNASWICEHVTFNRSLATATGQKMLVSAELVVPMPPEHGRQSLVRFVAQRGKKLISRTRARFMGTVTR